MPRSARIEVPGGIHHIWQRGNNRRAIFCDDGDRTFFLRLLGEVTRKREWTCLGYCLLTNHFHLVLETPLPTLSLGMRDLGSRYAQWFNEKHATGGGHLFQARFGSRAVADELQFAQLLRYVAMNPVQAGLCGGPGDWRWSSHLASVGSARHPVVATERVESLLEVYGGRAGARYAQLFADGGPLAHVDPSQSPWRLRPSLKEIFMGKELEVAIRHARDAGYRLAEIADHVGVNASTISRRLARQ